MAKKTTAVEAEVLTIPAIETKEAIIHIVGDSSLITHKWSEKAKREMLEKQMKVAKSKGKEAKSPEMDFIRTLYTQHDVDIAGNCGDAALYSSETVPNGFANAKEFETYCKSGGKFYFPSVAVKAAAISAGFRAGVTKNKVVMQGAFHILGEYLQIETDEPPTMREDMVKIAMGTADIRYRAEFKHWEMHIPVRYNTGVITLAQLCNLINLGGFACGIGEWRVERSGMHGMFHVE